MEKTKDFSGFVKWAISVFRTHAHIIWTYFPLHEQGLVSGKIMLMEVG
jgi:hypothetical protein